MKFGIFPAACLAVLLHIVIIVALLLNIDLSKSWMIGDSKNDIMAGKNAGCKTALIGNEDYKQDITVDSLLTFVNKIIKKM